MICESCSAVIDYRFLMNCEYCDSEILQTEFNSFPKVQSSETCEKSPGWKKRLANTAYIFASSIAGMISGAVVLYLLAGITYAAFWRSSGNPSLDCSRGSAIAFLSIVVGAYLGTVGASVFAVKCPPFGRADRVG